MDQTLVLLPSFILKTLCYSLSRIQAPLKAAKPPCLKTAEIIHWRKVETSGFAGGFNSQRCVIQMPLLF